MFFVIDLLNKGNISGLSLGLNIQFFNPCPPGNVKTKAKVLKSGKNFAFTQCDLINEQGIMASGTQQMKLFSNKQVSENSWFTPKNYSIID
jgi:acyl-coenzyme A thioesterase PaaI-like protein